MSKSFRKKVLIDNISFQLQQGKITTLIGQNGAGKSTIAKMLLGIEKPTQGTIKVKSNLKIGYVPQKLDFNSNIPLNSKDLVNILAPSSSKKIHNNFLNLEHFADLDSIKKTDISELSGGQLQRLLLTGTLMNNPDLIILDEPTQYLDVLSQQKFYILIKEMQKSTGLTVFLISHDLFTVMKNSDQVICINRHVCCIGKPDDNNNKEFKNALSEIGFYTHSHNHQHNY